MEKMELEAKLKVADRDTFSQILQLESLGRFEFQRGGAHQVEDIYQDTEENHLLRAGYACRIRKQDGAWTACLKEQSETGNAIHERLELDVALPYLELDPLRWPDSEARQLAIRLSGGAPLRRLFTIHQVRHTRIITDQSGEIAELSLDEVHLDVPGETETYFELEIECLPGGSKQDIQELGDLFMDQWALDPQVESKFLRAMMLINPDEVSAGSGSGDATHRLLPGNRLILEYIAEKTQPVYMRRAQLLLDWDDGNKVGHLIKLSGYSRSTVYHWLRAYHQEGLQIFPKQLLDQAIKFASRGQAESPLIRAETGETAAYSPQPFPIHLEDLYKRYDVDMEHAGHVARLALKLFDATQDYHGLSGPSRQLLEYGSLLHNVGMNVDPELHHTAGRDIIQDTPLVELDDEERLMVAATTFLHRKAITAEKLHKKTVKSVPEDRRDETLELAALIRIADGLDYSQSQSTRIVEINATPAVIEVILDGPYALHDAARAEKKTDLWDLLHPIRFYFRVHNVNGGKKKAGKEENNPSLANHQLLVESPEDQPDTTASVSFEPPPELDALAGWIGDKPGILPEDMMSEAGRKLFRFHLYRMLQHEAGTRKGEDIEDLHDMRVATRRLRSAFRLVNDFFVPKKTSPIIKGLRRTAGSLGAVRDLDVLMDKANQYQESLPPTRQDGLTPLLESWRAQRERNRRRMISYLDGDIYRRFVTDFTQFATTEGAGAAPIDPDHPQPYLVCHVVPRLIYTHYEAVRAYENWLDDPPLERLHALRIDCKRLRYALEFFVEVLGPEAKMVIKETISLQDHLGELHDADVADHLLRDFLDGGIGALPSTSTDKKKTEPPRQRIMAPGVALYLAEKQVELQTLVRTFPEAWANFNRQEVRQNLAASIAVL